MKLSINLKNTCFAILATLVVGVLTGCSGGLKGYNISGNISGLSDDAVLQFFPLSHINLEPVGEVKVVDGKFSFAGEAPDPRGLMMVVKNNYGSLRFVVADGEKIEIGGKVVGTRQSDGKFVYDFDDVTVSGSPTTDKFNRLMTSRRGLDARFEAVRRKYAKICKMFWEEGQNPAVIDSLRKTAEYQKMLEEEHQIFVDGKRNLRKVIAENKDTFWGPLLMIASLNYFSPDNREEYEMLSESAKNSHYGREVKAELYPASVPGDAVPAFRGRLIDGRQASLAELCKGKRYVLIDFWASWCKLCYIEEPHIRGAYDRHKVKGFDVVSVSIDDDDNQWRQAVAKGSREWANLRDHDKSISKRYQVSSVPSTYIVDGQGRLVAENLRGEELAAKIDELMTTD